MKEDEMGKPTIQIKTRREHLIYECAYAAGGADTWEWQALRAYIHLQNYDKAEKEQEREEK